MPFYPNGDPIRQIDWGNPITDGLVGFGIGNSGDLVGNRWPVAVGVPGRTVVPSGRAFLGKGATTDYLSHPAVKNAGVTRTVLASVIPGTLPASCAFVSHGGSSRGWMLGCESGNFGILHGGAGMVVSVNAATFFGGSSVTAQTVIGATTNPESGTSFTEGRLYKDGLPASSRGTLGSSYIAPLAVQPLSLGVRINDSGGVTYPLGTDQAVAAWAVWDRVLTDEEIAQIGADLVGELTRDPNQQLLQFFAASLGGALASLNAAASGSIGLTGSAAAALAIAGQGAGALPLTGFAQGTVRVQASSAGSLGLTGSATATAPMSATAAGSLAITGTATATARIAATGSGTLPLSGSAQAGGTAQTNAAASGSIGLTGSGAANALLAATASGSIGLTGSAAAGSSAAGAIGAGTISLTGAGTIAARITGAGAGQIGLGGATTVTVRIGAAAAGAMPLTGSAAAAERARVPSLIFKVMREQRVFRVAREPRLFRVPREQRIFKVARAS